jgi:hypothetical protein
VDLWICGSVDLWIWGSGDLGIWGSACTDLHVQPPAASDDVERVAALPYSLQTPAGKRLEKRLENGWKNVEVTPVFVQFQ